MEPGSLGEPSHEGFRNSVIERSFEPSIEDRHDLRSSGSLQDADSKFDERSEVGSIVSNISACVDAAFSMLPLEPPKPVWEQGVWADIFGDGVFMKSQWNTARLTKIPYHAMPQVAGQWGNLPEVRKSKVRKVSGDSSTYSDIVVQV